MAPRVFAIAAHPDDIEFTMAGTLMLLRESGCELHYMNIADGSCGSVALPPAEIARIRLGEAQEAAGFAAATFYPPIASDLLIFYNKSLLAKVASIIRLVAPDILLVPSPEDYMEDHMNACRLAVTAAFCRGMKNFPVDPPRQPVPNDIVVYHAQPYGNRDHLSRFVSPDFCIDITSVIGKKSRMLGMHKSQKEWLDASQGVDSYLEIMQRHAEEIGLCSGRFLYGEGWRRHNPLGFCAEEDDPLASLLSEYIVSLAGVGDG